MVTLKDLLDSITTSSPAAFPSACMIGLQNGLFIYQLTRVPLIAGFLCLIEKKRSRLTALFSYTAGLIAAILVLGQLLHFIPRFTILMSLWTAHIYFSLGLICLCAGIILTGLTPFHEQRVSEFFACHGSLTIVLALCLGLLSALIETPICPSCGSTISMIADAASGRGQGLIGIGILSLYALGECIPFLLPGILMITGKNMLYDKKSLNGQAALLAISLLLILSSLLFFWTC